MTPEDFWNQDDRHKDQKFYVAFCILESALGDYAIARDLHCHNKLNWASTAYYYSLVHALRLVCFIPLGDFTKGHTKLARLYMIGNLEMQDRWLPKIIRNCGGSTEIDRITFSRMEMVRYFGEDENSYSTLENRLKRWGIILDKARKCRNDSNYEGLIIAHEYAHRMVTDAFIELANVLFKICNDILPAVVLLFKKFIDNTVQRRDYWYSYLNWRDKTKGLYYIEASLKFRLLGEGNVHQINNSAQNCKPVFDIQNSNAIISDILEWLRPLRTEMVNEEFASEVLRNIKLEIFEGKKSLMQSFRDQIDKLE